MSPKSNKEKELLQSLPNLPKISPRNLDEETKFSKNYFRARGRIGDGDDVKCIKLVEEFVRKRLKMSKRGQMMLLKLLKFLRQGIEMKGNKGGKQGSKPQKLKKTPRNVIDCMERDFGDLEELSYPSADSGFLKRLEYVLLSVKRNITGDYTPRDDIVPTRPRRRKSRKCFTTI